MAGHAVAVVEVGSDVVFVHGVGGVYSGGSDRVCVVSAAGDDVFPDVLDLGTMDGAGRESMVAVAWGGITGDRTVVFSGSISSL